MEYSGFKGCRLGILGKCMIYTFYLMTYVCECKAFSEICDNHVKARKYMPLADFKPVTLALLLLCSTGYRKHTVNKNTDVQLCMFYQYMANLNTQKRR